MSAAPRSRAAIGAGIASGLAPFTAAARVGWTDAELDDALELDRELRAEVLAAIGETRFADDVVGHVFAFLARHQALDELVRLCQRHLEARVRRILRRYAYGRSVDELWWDTISRVYENADRYAPPTPLGPWVARLAVNQAIDGVRRGRLRHVLADLEAGARLAALVAQPPPWKESELLEEVHAAVAHLPPTRRAVAEDLLEGLAARASAERRSLTVATVHNYRCDLRALLRAWLLD